MTSTSTQDCAQVATRFVSAFNERDWEAMRALFAPDCVYEENAKPPRRVQGADAVVDAFQGWAGAVGELRGHVRNIVAAEDKVALEVALEGPMKAPFGDFSPTGKPPAVRGSFFFLFEDRTVRELRLYFDKLALFQILGIRP